MINICPIGRNASDVEREAFEQYDEQHHIRETMISDLQTRFDYLHFQYLIGGQTSFDVVPAVDFTTFNKIKGMDKTYCLQYLHNYTEIHFFGDKIGKVRIYTH